MIEVKQRNVTLFALASLSLALLTGRAFGFQTPQKIPVTHERQCVPTGTIDAGASRTITVTWKHPLASGQYDIIGSVEESGDSPQALELAHVVIPSTATTAAAVVSNRNTSAAESGILCLDASVH